MWDVAHSDLEQFKQMLLMLVKSIPNELKSELIDAFIEDNQYLEFVVKNLKSLE